MLVICFTACSNFLDVSPRDKMLEEDQYATEEGMNGALNGLYRQFISTSLYGATLTHTSLDAMAHYYTYPPVMPTGNFLSHSLYFLCNGRYQDNSSVEGIFSNTWTKAYSMLYNINFYLKSMDEATAVINPEMKDLMKGEAYGLRAYMHFDLFRLFGPRWENRSSIDKILPYNRSTDVVLNHEGYEEDVYITADEFLKYILLDIHKAEELLYADPILIDHTAITKQLQNDFYRNRNRRMNYYAVKALEARVLQYIGEHTEAAVVAKEVTDQIGTIFNWVNLANLDYEQNYAFFEEVIFGVNNPDMDVNYDNYFTKSRMEDIYSVDRDNLMQNIFAGFGDNLIAITDIRAKQWVQSNNSIPANYSKNGTFISKKFDIAAIEQYNALENFQPLIRTAEMYYIQAEAALRAGDKETAAKLLNDVSIHRGIPITHDYYLTPESSDEQFNSHIICEYYKELYGEGQMFFYHKRMNTRNIFLGYQAGDETVDSNSYRILIPKVETDI